VPVAQYIAGQDVNPSRGGVADWLRRRRIQKTIKATPKVWVFSVRGKPEKNTKQSSSAHQQQLRGDIQK
jgi:hypothetical protein